MMENIEEIQPTTQEILNLNRSRMITIQAELSAGDYKHSRQQRERQLKITLTMSEEDYTAFCAGQQLLVEEYNKLEVECKDLELLIKQEQESFNTGTI